MVGLPAHLVHGRYKRGVSHGIPQTHHPRSPKPKESGLHTIAKMMSLSGNGERRSGSRPSSAAREEGNFTKGRVHEGPDTRDFLNDDNPFDDVFIDEDQLLEYEGGGGGGGATIIFRVSL